MPKKPSEEVIKKQKTDYNPDSRARKKTAKLTIPVNYNTGLSIGDKHVLQGKIAEMLSQGEPEMRRQIEAESACFLDTTPEVSVTNMMKHFVLKILDLFAAPVPDEGEMLQLQAMLPVIMISLHGGLPVLFQAGDCNYKTFLAQSEFYRLIKTPNTCCALILPDVRQQYYDAVTKILKANPNSNIDDIIEKIKAALLKLSFDTQKECLKKGEIKLPERSIYKCRKHAFETVHTLKGQPVINKLWTADVYQEGDEARIFEGGPQHKLAPRGIIFCNTVVITLPPRWNILKYDYSRFPGVTVVNPNTNDFNGQEYQIGELNIETRQIRYIEKTNLLSCPYFMQYAKELLDDSIITLNNSLSIGAYNKVLIPMVTQITAQVLYRFLCKQKFCSGDTSCESLMFYDETGKSIQKDAITYLNQKNDQISSILQKLFNISPAWPPRPGRLRGGNRKTRYKTKKYKKRCNTKKNKRYNTKTKKYRKHNMSQKQ
jgi:hypothetical protein